MLTLALLLVACGDSPAATTAPSTAAANTQPLETSDGVIIEDTDTGKPLKDRLRFAATRIQNSLTDGQGRAAFVAYEFTAQDSRAARVSRFSKPVRITLKYDSILPANVPENNLTVLYYNPEAQNWEEQESTINSANKTISTEVMHFSKYGVGVKGDKGKGAAGVATKYDVTTALNTFSTKVFGRTYTYTDTGAVAAGIIASANFPENDKGILNAKLAAAGVAAYGKMSNGLEVALLGAGGVVTNDAAADIVAAGLGEVGMGGFTAPKSQDEALSFVNQVAPSLAGVGWTVKTTSTGSYIFYASGKKTIETAKGPVNTAIGGVASVIVGKDGKAIVTVQVGTGAYANLVK